MRRRLILMRHAKSDWDSGAATDHARPLNDRGRRDAPRMARRLEQAGWRPDLVLSSDSLRTTQTVELMNSVWKPPVRVDFSRSLYHAGIDALREAVAMAGDDLRCLMALGHNPGWQAAVAWLADEDVEMPTAAAALLELDADDWPAAVASRGMWKLRDVLRPKDE